MNPFKDLLGYKSEKLYDVKKKRQDIRYNIGRDYKEDGILRNSVSPFILRSQTLSEFVGFLDDSLYNITSGIRFLKNFKNYTTEKDDETVR
ncbi:hypothetical protein OAC86_00305 [bacterium]|jgi:hypothetical protein|nr:hypothetical protein [bacterium]MDB9899966.1 hypothetical protein [bacterium]|tara:strand:- start:300 stop:572 length:273 start_codon:yes stop_codon:yes gene_type:complete